MRLLSIVANNTIITLIVLCAFVSIRGGLAFGNRIVFVLGLAGGIAFILLTYSTFGEINTGSIAVMNSWKRFQEYPSSNDRKLMFVYIHSCPGLKVHLGKFGYYKKSNSPQMIGKLVYYTVKFLIMTKHLK